jgi:hypothetical protein
MHLKETVSPGTEVFSHLFVRKNGHGTSGLVVVVAAAVEAELGSSAAHNRQGLNIAVMITVEERPDILSGTNVSLEKLKIVEDATGGLTVAIRCQLQALMLKLTVAMCLL